MMTSNPTYTFNLIDREWIRAVRGDGSPATVGIHAALTQAHTLHEVHGDTPPETAAILRLLLTVLYRIFDPLKDWDTLWRAGGFDPQRVDGYLRRSDIYSRFDLFDQYRPFFQAGPNSPVWKTKFKVTSVMDLCLPLASDDAAVLFNHRTAGFHLTPPQTARALITHQAFALSGLNDPYAPSKDEIAFSNAPCSRGVIFFLEGRNLFETLLLNFFPQDLETDFRLPRQRQDRPAWEIENPFVEDFERPYGYLDYATWLGRRVLLYPEGDMDDPVVYNMRFYVGMKRMSADPLNPLMSYNVNTALSKGKPGGEVVYSPITFRPDRALWRDSVSLFAWAEEKARGQIPPRAVVWIGSEKAIENVLKRTDQFFLGAYGVCSATGKQKMYSFHTERFPLPAVYLQEAGLDAAKQLKLALQRAEETARILSPVGALGEFAEHMLSAKDKSADRNQVRKFVKATGSERYFWSRLEGHFVRLVQDLPEQTEAAVQAWNDALRGLARQSFEQAVQTAGGGRALAAYGQAVDPFEWQLKNVFDPPEVKAEREQKRQARRAKQAA